MLHKSFDIVVLRLNKRGPRGARNGKHKVLIEDLIQTCHDPLFIMIILIYDIIYLPGIARAVRVRVHSGCCSALQRDDE